MRFVQVYWIKVKVCLSSGLHIRTYGSLFLLFLMLPFPPTVDERRKNSQWRFPET
jgi:hypothetical protein